MKPDKSIWFMDLKDRFKQNLKTMESTKHSLNYSAVYLYHTFSTRKLWSAMVDYQLKIMLRWLISKKSIDL